MNLAKIRFNIKLGWLVIILYFYVYNPVFSVIGIGSVKVVLLYVFLYSIVKTKILHYIGLFKIELFLTSLLVMYSMITSVRINEFTFHQAYLFFMWFVESIYVPIGLVVVFNDQFKKYGWDKLILWIGLIAGVLSLILIVYPELNEYVRYKLIASSGEKNDRYESIRGFGFAEALRGAYGMAQGIILGICLNLVKEKWSYIVVALLLLISIAFNARTGLIAFPVSIVILLFRLRSNRRLTISILATVLLIYNVDFSSFAFVSNYEKTFDWISVGLLEATEVIQGDNSSFVGKTLLVDEKFSPVSRFDWLLGTGHFGPGIDRVDNGYYYLLWFGGWSIMMSVVAFLIYMFIRLSRRKEYYYSVLFFILLLIFSVKSNYLFNPSSIARLFGIYYVYTILNHKAKLNSLVRV